MTPKFDATEERMAMHYIITISPENWQQISREIRADNKVALWLRAMISVFNAKHFEQAMVCSEVINRICRARVLALSKEEKPFYDLTKESFLPPPLLDFNIHKAGHGSEAVQRFLLRSVTPPDRRHDAGTLDGKNQSPRPLNRGLETGSREHGTSGRNQSNYKTPDEDPAA
jgi:hypothetical protein